MANNVNAFVKQKYTKTVQALLEEKLIAMDIARTSLKADLGAGNTVNYPRPTYQEVSNYTKYTDVVDKDINTSNETLTINKTPIISFVMDEIDNIETSYDIVRTQASKNAYKIRQYVEGDVLNEVLNAGSTNTSAITLSESNVANTYGSVFAELVNAGVDDKGLVMLVDPFQVNTIGLGAISNAFKLSDSTYARGYKGEFLGMKLYQTTNLTSTFSLAVGTNPTVNDTITVNGKELTIVATATNEGEITRAGTVADTRTNIANAINGTGTGFVVNERAKLEGITAVVNGSAIDFTSKRGYKVVSSDLTASADKFGAVVIHNAVMEKGAIDLVIAKDVSVKVQDVQKQLGTRYMTWTHYGTKTFTEGAEKMYDLKIVSQVAE